MMAPARGFRFLYLIISVCYSTCQGIEWPVREFRGVWVATVANIDWPSSRSSSTAQQQRELDDIVRTTSDLNMNAIVFQVRTSGDAMYNSSLEPWSYYLTGTQGKPPSPYYDPLEYLIKKAHAVGIEVHAWFNPYRARSGSTSSSGLAPDHVVHRFPQHVYAYGHNMWMDPGAMEIQDFIVSVFEDVTSRYDIDGIHMDDYFYPYPVSGQAFPDSQTYTAYKHIGGTMSLADWRRSNVDKLVHRLQSTLHNIKPHIKYGISPFGIWKSGYPAGIRGLSAYDELYADARHWFRQGWLDYLAPQLYWQIDPPQQSFPALLDWWLQQNGHSRHLYTGIYTSAITAKSWDVDELINQVHVCRTRTLNNSLGNIQFSMKSFEHNIKGVSDRFKTSIYTTKALPPAMPWLNVSAPTAPVNVLSLGHRLYWSRGTNGDIKFWSIYKQIADSWNLVRVVGETVQDVDIHDSGIYAVRGVNSACVESQAVSIVVDVDTAIVG